MKVTPIYTILFFLAASLSNCGDVCPPDEKVGEINLHADTKAWMPYDGSETLIFVNQEGDELEITAQNGKETSIDMACTKQICTEPDDFDPNSTCEFYDSEANRFVFSNMVNFTADILYFSEVVRPNSEEFYQSLRVALSYQEGFFGMGQLITKTIPEQNINPSEVGIEKPFSLEPSVTLNGKTYNNVLKSVDFSMTIYFSKSEGLVGFETADETWNLK